jgi:hypothetical protein
MRCGMNRFAAPLRQGVETAAGKADPLKDPVNRLGCWCGVLSVTLIGAGFFPIDEGGTTGPDGSIAVLVDEILRHPGRIVVGSVVGMAGALLVIWFVSALRIRLARDGELGAWIGSAAFGSGVLIAAGGLIHGSFRLAMTTVKDAGTLGEAMRPLAILGSHSTDALFWGIVGLVVAMSIAAFTVRLLPRAMAVMGLVLSAATIALAPTDHGAAAVALFPWLIVACLRLLRTSAAKPIAV